MYWKFSDVGKIDAGYPRQLDKGFPGIPSNADAAFVWPSDDQIYFLKGSNWDGIPENPDSSLQYSNGRTYFFKNGHYYRLDNG